MYKLTLNGNPFYYVYQVQDHRPTVRVSSPILTASIRVVVVGIETRAGNDANWSRIRACPIRQP